MKIILTADIHCGFPNRLKDNIWSLNAISDYAAENNIENIVCLGDLYHNRDHLTIDIINHTHDFFKNSKQNWIAFPGNHDMFMKTSWDINSVKPLEKYITVYNNIDDFVLGGQKFVVVPFMHYESDYMFKINELQCEDSILLTHIGVNNAVNNSCFLIQFWSIVSFVDIKFKYVFSGHFHNHQSINNKVFYPGSPIPFKFDEGMVPHGFIVYDTKTNNIEFIDLRKIRSDCPKDFITLTDESVREIINEGDFDYLKNNKVRISLDKEYSKIELDKIRSSMISEGVESVSWMQSKDISYDFSEVKIDTKKCQFLQWLDHDNNDKFDRELLEKLYFSISEEAEELYNSSGSDLD